MGAPPRRRRCGHPHVAQRRERPVALRRRRVGVLDRRSAGLPDRRRPGERLTMPTFADHLAACRTTAGSEADALRLAETTWDTLPARLAADRGHTVAEDGVTHRRWTCVYCQRAVLRVDANIYGSAIEADCTP